MIRLSVVTPLLCAALMLAPQVRAAGEGGDGAAAAEALFQEARKLMDEKRYADACPKFVASQRAAPAIGTLLNLADCYEKNNQLASAWIRFREAVVLSQQLGRANREQTARERAERLEPRLAKLSILTSESGVDVKVDGNPLDPAVLGTPRPIDSGKHTIEASARGKKPFATTIDISDKPRTSSVTIPELEDDGTSLLDVSKDTDARPAKNDKPTKREKPAKLASRSDWSTQKTIGVVVASAGVLSLGVGTVFGLKTSSTWKEAQRYCTGLECDQQGVDLAAEAKTTGNIATVGVIAGSALLIGGAALYLTAPTSRRGDPSLAGFRVGIGPSNIVLGGSFH